MSGPSELTQWRHLDGAECVAGWSEHDGLCIEGGGPVVHKAALKQLQAAQAENQQLRKANDGLYRQNMAKELRALQEFRRVVFAALPTIWKRDDPHATVFQTIAEAHNALEQHAALGQVDQP